MSYTILDSPIGSLKLVATDSGVLDAVYMHEHRHSPDTSQFGEHVSGTRARETFGQAIEELTEYFESNRTEFTVPRRTSEGTEFQRAVWAELTRIPYGETISYATLAERIGNPRAVRAVGLANGRNPLSIIVPCHRVVGANGSLTGYGGGLERKQFLLTLEAHNVGRTS